MANWGYTKENGESRDESPLTEPVRYLIVVRFKYSIILLIELKMFRKWNLASSDNDCMAAFKFKLTLCLKHLRECISL